EDRAARSTRFGKKFAEGVEIHGLGLAVKKHERSDQDEQTDVRGDQVVEAREANFLVSVVPDDEHPRGDGGDLPPEQEHERVLYGVDEDERDRSDVEEREVRPAVPPSLEPGLEVAQSVNRSEKGHGERPREKEGAQSVDAERDPFHGRGPAPRRLERLAGGKHGDYADKYEGGSRSLTCDGDDGA